MNERRGLLAKWSFQSRGGEESFGDSREVMKGVYLQLSVGDWGADQMRRAFGRDYLPLAARTG